MQAVSPILEGHGVSTDGPEDCARVHATLSISGHDVDVRLTNGAGRTDLKTVGDAATAATLIESWARSDLTEPLLQPVPRKSAPTDGSEPRDEEILASKAGAPSQSQRPIGYVVGLRPGMAFAGDGSTWFAVAATGCIRVGRHVCPGVAIRYNIDLGISGHSAQLETSRSGAVVLATTEYLIELSHWVVSPGLGLGAGWLRSKLADRSTGTVQIDSGGLSLEAFVRAFYVFPSRNILGMTLSAGINPLAHTSDFVDPDGTVAGNPLWTIGLTVDLAYGRL